MADFWTAVQIQKSKTEHFFLTLSNPSLEYVSIFCMTRPFVRMIPLHLLLLALTVATGGTYVPRLTKLYYIRYLQHDNGTQSSGRQQKAEGETEVRLLALPVGFLLARQQVAALTAWDACSQQAGTGVILLYLRCRHMRCSLPIFREYGRSCGTGGKRG
jgi:hypothetical protein